MKLIRQWFDTSNPDAELAARYITLILWVIGSFYLMAFEWKKSPFDFVIFISTPVVWAVIISLPVMSIYAWKNRRYVASILIGLSAIVGSLYTATNTISRQAIMRDSGIINQDRDAKHRTELEKSLTKNQKMLDEELRLKRNKCDTNNKFDCDQIEASITVYEKAVKSDKADLAALGKPTSLLAGEERLATFLAWFREAPEHEMKTFVALVYPAIFGVFVELAALAVAMFGWHNYGLLRLEYNPGRLSDRSFQIEVLKHQLAIAEKQGNSIDIRVIKQRLIEAKSQLRKELE